MASSPITSCPMEEEKVEAVTGFLFLGFEITADGDCSHEIRRLLILGRKAITNLDSVLKSRDITFADKSPYSQGCGLSRSHVWMWELNHKRRQNTEELSFWTVVLEKTLWSPMDCKEILWLPDAKSWLTGKDPDAGKDWKQKEKRVTVDEMVGFHH